MNTAIAKVDTPIESRGWYKKLVADCIIIYDGAEKSLIFGYHALGKRILSERENFDRSYIYGRDIVSRVTLSLGDRVSDRTVWRAMQFARKYPDLNALPKDVNWRDICNNLLPDPNRAKGRKNGHNIELLDSENEGAKVERGDVWKLGKHTLYCGDTSGTEFQSMLSRSALAFADPPYGAGVKGFDDSCFYWEHDYLIDYANIVTVTPGIVSIFEFARKTAMPYKWSLATWITNGMTRGALGFGNWIYTAVFSNGSIHRNAQDFSRVSIRTTETGETKHKGRKPAAYMLWIIELFSQSGNTVIDPFLGSGQTLLACEKLNRTCIGGEIKEKLCSDIIGRWEKMTDRKAVKE